jgi:hypothetical protein
MKPIVYTNNGFPNHNKRVFDARIPVLQQSASAFGGKHLSGNHWSGSERYMYVVRRQKTSDKPFKRHSSNLISCRNLIGIEKQSMALVGENCAGTHFGETTGSSYGRGKHSYTEQDLPGKQTTICMQPEFRMGA